MEPQRESNRPELVSVGLFIPYDGIPHAGGEYLLRHFAALAPLFAISVYAPAIPENATAAVKDMSIQVNRRAVEGTGPLSKPWLKPLRDIIKLVRGASLSVDVERALKRDKEFVATVRRAAVVEFQWTEAMSLHRFLCRVNPTALKVLVVHDVLSQRWTRAAATAQFKRASFIFRLRALSALRAERQAFTEAEVVLVFSNKDREEVLSIAPSARVHVNPPSLVDFGMPSAAAARRGSPTRLLFTGALSRPENHEALIWFLNEIWPLVHRQCNDVTFVIAGASPLEQLIELVDQSLNVELTGYVTDLGPYYEDSTIFVVPLRRGAGVKFKTITAMLWGLPIVSTTVGAEGVGDESHYLAVSDDPIGLADGIIDALADDRRRYSIAQVAFSWSHVEFGKEQFLSRIKQFYEEGKAADDVSPSDGEPISP